MAEGTARRERVPGLMDRAHWGRYAAGMLAETAFILVLTAIGFVLAVISVAITR